MSILKKGKPYVSVTPDKFLTPREESLKQYYTVQKQKADTLKKWEDETKEADWILWKNELSEEELLPFNPDLAPDDTNTFGKLNVSMHRKRAIANAKEYFENII